MNRVKQVPFGLSDSKLRRGYSQQTPNPQPQPTLFSRRGPFFSLWALLAHLNPAPIEPRGRLAPLARSLQAGRRQRCWRSPLPGALGSRVGMTPREDKRTLQKRAPGKNWPPNQASFIRESQNGSFQLIRLEGPPTPIVNKQECINPGSTVPEKATHATHRQKPEPRAVGGRHGY